MKPLVEIRSGLGIDFESRLLGFSYENNDRRKDKVRFELDNRDLELFEWYPPGATAAVRWGYPGNLSPWRVVQFRRITGFTRLTLEANSLEAALDRVERTEAYYGGTHSQIVEGIARTRYGFDGRLLHVEETVIKHDLVNQIAETDAVFLKRLASEEGFVFYVDDTGLHWHSPRYDEPPIRIIEWRGSGQHTPIIEEPRLELDLLRHYRRVKKKKHDPNTKGTEEEEVDVTTDTDAKELGIKALVDNLWETERVITAQGESRTVRKFNPERAYTIIDKAAREVEHPGLMSFVQTYKQDPNIAKTINPALLQSLVGESLSILSHGSAKRRKRALASKNIKFSVRIHGDPSARAGEVVRVLGLPKILEGNFYSKRCTHMIGDGYSCTFDLQKHNPEKNPRKGKLENTGASVNTSAETQEGKPKTVVDEKGRVYVYPPGFIGPI